jgi:hypothetical protein
MLWQSPGRALDLAPPGGASRQEQGGWPLLRSARPLALPNDHAPAAAVAAAAAAAALRLAARRTDLPPSAPPARARPRLLHPLQGFNAIRLPYIFKDLKAPSTQVK